MGALSTDTTKKYTLNKQVKTIKYLKMNGFNNFATMIDTMLSQPEFEKMATKLKGDKERNSVTIPLKSFSPQQVQLNMNKNGLVTVTASRENTEESDRNGQRKTTVMVEETLQLPGYLIDNDLLKTVESKFHDGFLVLSYAEDPKLVEEKKEEETKNAPIEIPILMED